MDRILNPGSRRLGAGASVVVILILGFGGLLSGHMTQPTQGVTTAVIVPPWRPIGFAFAAEVGLSPVDVRWGGWLVIFPPTREPPVIARMGPFVMPADGRFGCGIQS